MWVEGTLGIVPQLAPKIMLNEEGENITLSNNTEMFSKWADVWERENPFKYTPVIHNYAATNLIPRHLGPEYIIHGAKLYSPWDPTKTEVTLVVSEWFFDRSLHLIKTLDEKDHPFSKVVVMVPPAAITHEDYDLMTDVPVRTQHRGAPDFMDLCEADVETEWFMITNSYHHVARHVDLMFTPGKFNPVIPFTPATYAFCFKYPYCKESVALAQRFNPGHDKVVLDMDMLYNTELRNKFCKDWKNQNGEEGEDMYKNQQRRLMFRKKIIGPPGPTGTSYLAWLAREGKDGMYKLTDRSLYGARPPFVKIFAKEEKLDGMSEDELAKRVGMTLLDNSTDVDCNCMAFETETDCEESGFGCIWRPLFESCHPPELIDGNEPICASTVAPTMAPTVSMEGLIDETESPTIAPSEPLGESDPWYVSMFKSREHDATVGSGTDDAVGDSTLLTDDDDAILEPTARKLESVTPDSWYETNLIADQRIDTADSVEPRRKLQTESVDVWYEKVDLPNKQCNTLDPSVVPRQPTRNGPTTDLDSRAFSAMAISRPRRLHRTFLASPFQPKRIADINSPLQDSWLTSSIPINIPKYSSIQHKNGLNTTTYIPLATPEHQNGKLPTMYRSIVNYGDLYQPLRLTFVTDDLVSMGNGAQAVTAAALSKSETLTGDILPIITHIFSTALSVQRLEENMFVDNQLKCGEADIPPDHSTIGIPNTDTLLYVTANGPGCYIDGTVSAGSSGVTSYASVCLFDQHFRPTAGNLVVCLDAIDASLGEVSEQETLRLTSVLTMEVGKVLGLSSSLFQYYQNKEAGKPWGTTEKTGKRLHYFSLFRLIALTRHSH